MLGASERLPIHKECDRILRFRVAVVRLASSYSARSAGDDTGRYGLVLEDPTTYIDMVR